MRPTLVVLVVLVALLGAHRGAGQDAAPAGGERPRPAPGPAVRLQVGPLQHQGIFRVGDPVEITPPEAIVHDLRGRPVTSPFPAGHYFVRHAAAAAQFAVLPDNWPVLQAVGSSGAYAADPLLDARAERLRLGWIRLTIGWDDVQPGGAADWEWGKTDRILAFHRGKRKICALLHRVPAWVRDPRTRDWRLTAAEFVAAYERFAGAVGHRYGGQIDLLEYWNEPWPDQLPVGGGDLTDVARLCTGLARAARRAFPGRVLLAGPTLNNPVMLQEERRFAAAGLEPFVEVIDFHDYHQAHAAPDEHGWYRGRRSARLGLDVSERVRRHRELWGHKPVAVTELGLFGGSALGRRWAGEHPDGHLGWRRGMYRAFKTAVMYRAETNVILMPHILLGAGGVELDGWEGPALGPFPKTTAFLMACYWTEQAVCLRRELVRETVWLYEFRRPDGRSLVLLWCREGRQATLPGSWSGRLLDFFGQPAGTMVLGEAPRLVYGQLDEVRAALGPPAAR